MCGFFCIYDRMISCFFGKGSAERGMGKGNQSL